MSHFESHSDSGFHAGHAGLANPRHGYVEGHHSGHAGGHGEHHLSGKEVAFIGLGIAGVVVAGMVFLVKNIAEKSADFIGIGGDHGHGHGHSGGNSLDLGELMLSFIPSGGGGGGKSSHGGGHH